MKLGSFFAEIEPYLQGTLPHESVARRLYGAKSADGVDARRLAIYGEFCRAHRFQAVDPVHAATREAVLELAGEAGWERLVEAYFVAHPMKHVELNENGAELAAFLASGVGHLVPGLPPWVAELAELEWWEWHTQNAPDEPRDLEPGGELRLASTVELRRFGHDLVGWLSRRETPAPEAREVVVLFWRDAELHYRRENASPLELWLLKSILEGTPLHAVQEAGQIRREQLEQTLTDLRDAGIVLGMP